MYCRYLFDCFRANRKKNYFHTWCGKRLTKNATRGVDLLIAHTRFNSLRSMTHFLLFFNWINDSNWTECRVQFGLKSYAWFQNWTSVQHEFDLESQLWFQIKIAQQKVPLPLYDIHFEITQIQDLVSSNILLMQYWASLKLN